MGAFHARSLAGSDLVEVAAVVDTVTGRADGIAGEIGAEAVHSLAALPGRSDVEAWLIATPTSTHPEVVTAALDLGLHVLCEKPLDLDLARSEHLGRRAAAIGLTLQVGFWRRFSPPWAQARRLLSDGAIGRPLMLRLAQWDADPPPAEFCDPAASGGLAIDCGVHEFDLVEWMTGLPVERVTSRNLPLVDGGLAKVGDVDNLVALLDLRSGPVATVDLTRNCRYGDDVRTEILGEEGAIFIETLPAGRARLATAGGIVTVAGSETDDALAAGVIAQAEAFAAAVRGEAVEVPGATASTRAVALGRAVQESAATGSPINLA
jgi:predicted dehydrogenase